MDWWYKWFDKKQAGGRKQPYDLCLIAIQGRNQVFRQAGALGPPSLPRLPHIHFPWRIFTLSSWALLLPSKHLFTAPHDRENDFYQNLRVSSLRPQAPCQTIYTTDPCVSIISAMQNKIHIYHNMLFLQ